MNRLIISLVSFVVITFSHLSISQQLTEPEMTFHKLDELPASSADDGRESRRIVAATVGVSRVEWPAGTTTTAHNHANELVVVLLEGRLKAISGDREFILTPGELVVIPAYVEHHYEALEDSVTLEALGPG